MRKVLAGLIIVLMVSGGGAAYANSKDEANDHILIGRSGDYQEYFKKDHKGGHDKNYLYTISHQKPPALGTCDVYTFAAERAGAVVCNIGGQIVSGAGSSIPTKDDQTNR